METNPAEQNLRVATRLGHLHVRIVGPDELPTAVLWPSMFSDGHAFERVVPLLNRHRRLVIVDPPGSARATRSVSSQTSMAWPVRRWTYSWGSTCPSPWTGLGKHSAGTSATSSPVTQRCSAAS